MDAPCFYRKSQVYCTPWDLVVMSWLLAVITDLGVSQKTFPSDVQLSKKKGSQVQMFAEMQAAVPRCQPCLPWVSVAGAWALYLHSWHWFVAAEVWAEGILSQGDSHSLAFPSFLFPLQNFKNK